MHGVQSSGNAEGAGFGPALDVVAPSMVFETTAIGHSAIPPKFNAPGGIWTRDSPLGFEEPVKVLLQTEPPTKKDVLRRSEGKAVAADYQKRDEGRYRGRQGDSKP